ncbi:ATP-dependent zinc metalloprotease FtsH [Defluviitalea phaphyphila]|uniref:ATP-dependent zinc metalloprotease FtsH n=1 Tax=Defluviitalea phaphyphila TaxID=1473580 RepID=UPI0007DC1269|nr:ATP-dependent zinc metalloprotease FtsH [Defluviitalea phaphyphila]
MWKKQKIIWVIPIICVILILAGLYIYKQNQVEEMTYSTFLEKVEAGQIEEVVIDGSSKMKVKVKGDLDTSYITDNPRNPELKEFLLKKNIKVEETDSITTTNIFQGLIMLGIFFIAFRYASKKITPQNSGSSMNLNIKELEFNKIQHFSFSDVAGNEEAKEQVEDIIDFLKNPEKYVKYGARMPKGIIFYGPPGTGKTLMAKAISGEAKVPFFSVSGSDFVQMYVGVGASRVRELFEKARKAGKAVIFIDEIDALGKKRANNPTGGNDERDQTLNALLTEMSGFKENEGIIVIAATNRLDILDEALLRPGRFDRHVEIGLPDVNGREHILKLHVKNKPISDQVDLKKLAKQTVYFSGAMLENLLNEAAIISAKRNGKFIDWNDIDKAFYAVVAGSEKKNRDAILKIEREITAYHEAGHALITKLVAPNNTVSRVTIIPSTKGAGGFSMNIPPDKMYYTKKEMEAQIKINLAGRVAEELIFGEDNITTGASNDIEKATKIIRDYIIKYGMSKKVGLLNMDVLFNNKSQGFVEKTLIEECSKSIKRLYDETKETMIENKFYLNQIAEILLLKESINEDDLNDIMERNFIIEEKNVNKSHFQKAMRIKPVVETV